MASVILSTQRYLSRSFVAVALGVGWFDLIIASLIALAIVLLGRAIVSYELFTGKNLPRRGFFRHWQRAVILAAGYGGLMGLSLALQLHAVYSLLLTAVLMVAFFALLAWRSYGDRQRYIEHLRPFVASQNLYAQLVTPTAPSELDATPLLRALCHDVLGARAAALVAIGPLAPLAGPPLAYPQANAIAIPPLAEMVTLFDSPQTMCVPLDPPHDGGALWAVPLWNERGLAGVLLLGAKLDGGLYTQEEIEIARASAERLIDTQAGAEMARRLMALQRQRLAQSQVVDQRTRRVLHDEVLPSLHAALLTLGDGAAATEAVSLLTGAHRQIANLLREMPAAAAPEVARLGLIGALRQNVDETLASAFDQVSWEIEPLAEQRGRAIPSLTAEVLFYAAREAIRNAACHGRPADSERPLHLRVTARWCDGLELTVEDDGVGLDQRQDGDDSSGGSGQGLALHSTMMAVVGGTLALESAAGAYTRVTLTLPERAW
jgi:signal transduction histidine kinase